MVFGTHVHIVKVITGFGINKYCSYLLTYKNLGKATMFCCIATAANLCFLYEFSAFNYKSHRVYSKYIDVCLGFVLDSFDVYFWVEFFKKSAAPSAPLTKIPIGEND